MRQEEGTLAGMHWSPEIGGTSLQSPSPAEVHAAAFCSTQTPSVPLLELWCGTLPRLPGPVVGTEVAAAKAHAGWVCGLTLLGSSCATSSLVC